MTLPAVAMDNAAIAQDYNNVPVRMQNKKNKGNSIELQITALEIEGDTVQIPESCFQGSEIIRLR